VVIEMTKTQSVLFAAAVALVVAVGARSAGQTPTTTAGVAAAPGKASVRRQASTGARGGGPAASRPRVPPAPTEAAFQAVTHALLNDTCGECHNNIQLEAGLDLTRSFTVESLTRDRDLWELVLAKLKAREMPPPDVVRPDQQVDALAKFLEHEFDRADAAAAPDPGHVVAHRLNRTEYTNTIRDLLAIEFRADKDFPTDDSGDGFDNIGDVLTVSPVLMEKYLSAASRCPSPSKSSTACGSRTCGGWIRATSRRLIASISTPITRCASDCRATARKTPNR
jgi:hypothetical protein